MGKMYTAVKVFSATKAREREGMGEQVTKWLQNHQKTDDTFKVCDTVVTQSSDSEYHCFTITIFYCSKNRA